MKQYILSLIERVNTKENEICVICSTLEESQKLFTILHREGWRWNGDSILDDPESDTAYFIDKEGKITRDSINTAENEFPEIIIPVELILDFEINNTSYEIY